MGVLSTGSSDESRGGEAGFLVSSLMGLRQRWEFPIYGDIVAK